MSSNASDRTSRFLTTLLKLLGQLPIYPMFGRGLTKLQPAYVEDVAEAIARALQRTDMHAITFECGGPRAAEDDEVIGIRDDVCAERFPASGSRQYFRNRFMPRCLIGL
jgi:nucleoside-diphosphate-sugar epimerase